MILVGDCRESMAAMKPASIDAIVCDPPYGLSFMGKGWDHAVPGEDFWREALRVAKPGAFLLAFGGTRKFHRLACAIEDAGWQLRDTLMWMYGQGFPKGKGCLKPAWEPIVMASKKGRGALNIDACRLRFASEGDKAAAAAAAAAQRLCHAQPGAPYGGIGKSGFTDGPGSLAPYLAKMGAGRWPANVILDEEAAAMLDEQAGPRGRSSGVGGVAKPPSAGTVYSGGWAARDLPDDVGFGDSGGPSRFFYCAKASRGEREAGLREAGQRYCMGNFPSEGPARMGATNVINRHPTVKPLAVMRWLVRLVTPPGGLVLDPFSGSGSTGCAAALEGMRFVGCEIDPEYARIAEARIAHWGAQRPLPVAVEA